MIFFLFFLLNFTNKVLKNVNTTESESMHFLPKTKENLRRLEFHVRVSKNLVIFIHDCTLMLPSSLKNVFRKNTEKIPLRNCLILIF